MASVASRSSETSYFGEQLKSRRRARGLSQPALAELVQVDYARRKGIDVERVDAKLLKPTRFDLIRWEKGQAPRDQDMLAALAFVLGCDVDNLLRPEHALVARDKAMLHSALEPLVDVLYDLLKQKIEGDSK
jgi:transcriptional regulator with XRE-family HTH domain